VFRITGDGQQGFRRGPEENAVNDLFVEKSDSGKLFRNGKDDMEVLTLIAAKQVNLSPDKSNHASALVVWQQFFLPAFQPLCPLRVLA
jgi:hypothetical protein